MSRHRRKRHARRRKQLVAVYEYWHVDEDGRRRGPSLSYDMLALQLRINKLIYESLALPRAMLELSRPPK